MFADLPQDLLKSVIIDWLDTNGLAVSALDVAFARRFRGDWLHLLPSLRLVNPPMKQALPTFFSWVHGRGVQLDTLSVDLSLAEELDRVTPSFRFPSLTLTALAITNRRNVSSPFCLMSLISLAPSLLVLDFRGYVLTDAQLLHCAHSGCCPLLKELKLSSSNISSAAVVAVATHYSDTLQVLHCVVLNDSSVMSLARCCKKMKTIVWSVFNIAYPACLVKFCAATTDLEHIELSYCERVTNEIIEQISLHCPKLKVLKLFCPAEEISGNIMTNSVIPLVVANCKDLRELCLAGASLEFETDGSGTKGCNLIGDFETPEELHNVLPLLTIPIYSIGRRDGLCWTDRHFMSVLVERNYKSLRKAFLYWDRNSDIDQQSFLYFCSSCPNLIALALWVSTECAIVDEEFVRNIAKRCPQLQQLDLACPALTDAAVLAGLDGFCDGVLTSIGLAACKISDVVVDKVVELFPHLQGLRLRNTSVSKDRLAQYISKHQFRSLHSVTLPSPEDNNWMRMQLHAMGLPMTVSLTP